MDMLNFLVIFFCAPNRVISVILPRSLLFSRGRRSSACIGRFSKLVELIWLPQDFDAATVCFRVVL